MEVASLGALALLALGSRAELKEALRDEATQAGVLRASPSVAEWKRWSLPLTNGVLRESLRLNPPAGGGFRVAQEGITVGGYDVEAGTVVTADPRISNAMPTLHPQPSVFEPRRWVAPAAPDAGGGGACPFAGAARRLGSSAWHPGGIGAHGCPGVPLAELCGRVLLTRWLERVDSWRPVDGSPAEVPYELIPIKIPLDDYALKLTVT